MATQQALTIPAADSLAERQAARLQQAQASLPAFKGRYIASSEEVEATATAIEELEKRPPLEWVAARIYALLHHYFVAEVPLSVQEAIGAQWLGELKDFPAWAIEDACAWWVGRNNSKRGKKPVPGDIGEVCERLTAPLRVARIQIERRQRHGDNPPAFMRGGSS